MDAEDHTVGAVAELSGISVRSLRHYDEIGLLRPSRRSAAGYRLYSPGDLRRLQRIAFYRELGFGGGAAPRNGTSTSSGPPGTPGKTGCGSGTSRPASTSGS